MSIDVVTMRKILSRGVSQGPARRLACAPMEPDERRGRRRIPGWAIAVVAIILGLALMIFLHVTGMMGRGLHG
jgi:hypothetical protein